MLYEEIRTLRTLGVTDQEIRRSAKNYQSYVFTAPAGQVTSQQLQIPGTAIVMLGFVVSGSKDVTGDVFTLRLNNEVLAENLPTVQCGGQNVDNNTMNLFPLGYVEVTRRMTGRDTLTIDYTSNSGGSTVSFTVVYLTNYTSALRK